MNESVMGIDLLKLILILRSLLHLGKKIGPVCNVSIEWFSIFMNNCILIMEWNAIFSIVDVILLYAPFSPKCFVQCIHMSLNIIN